MQIRIIKSGKKNVKKGLVNVNNIKSIKKATIDTKIITILEKIKNNFYAIYGYDKLITRLSYINIVEKNTLLKTLNIYLKMTKKLRKDIRQDEDNIDYMFYNIEEWRR